MSITRRILMTGFVAAALACASSDHHHGRQPISSSSSSATVVVHAADASVDTAVVRVNARNGKTPSGVAIPSQIMWSADDATAKLMIELVDAKQNCIIGKHCTGSVCQALTNVNSTGDRCEYKVWINSTVAKDPVVIIENCCP